MLFNSIQYLVFLPIVVGLYFSIPQRLRWALLLLASYYFYMCWKAEYLVLILFSTAVDYFCGLGLQAFKKTSARKLLLITSVSTNIGILIAFKYFNFFSDSLRAVLNYWNIFYDQLVFNALLPVGISFYSFQSLSYTIDVYRGHRSAERHAGIFALYVAFFPQLVAGPIERSTRLLPQFFEKHSFHVNQVTDGLRLILWGLFKKVVIADRVGIYVDEIFNNPGSHEGVPVILGTYFFAFQIYCDFSGYSDIAIGSALILGYRLMNNFDRPYSAASIPEFWRRWHISLSTWFRDYVYFPLGGSRSSVLRNYYNLMVVFLLSGLWHGANWTFIIWGGLHGFYMIIFRGAGKFREFISSKLPAKAMRLLSIVLTFHLVCLGWIFFKANSISDAFTLLQAAARINFNNIGINILGDRLDLMISLVAILFLEAIQLLQKDRTFPKFIGAQYCWIRWSFYIAITLIILNIGNVEKTPFIYFQF